jgi:quinol monooxygenase YgiN
MTTVVTYIEVQPRRTSDAIALMRAYRLSNAQILQEIHRKHRFVIVETWADDGALQAHDSAEHTVQFLANVKDIRNAANDRRVHTTFATGSAATPGKADSVYVVTHVDVPPPRREEVEVQLKRISETSPKDAGYLRYDVYQQLAPRTNHFTVVECWADEQAFAAHEAQSHTRDFRDALGPMLGAPYDDRLYRSI